MRIKNTVKKEWICPFFFCALRTILRKNFIIFDKSEKEGGGCFAVKKRKLNYRFHNPNSAEATADTLLKVLIEANSQKVEKVMQEVAEQVHKKCDVINRF